jgi:NADH-quinone oxidoreductase subunit L
MLAIGAARMCDFSGYSASIFHLFTHAFFKALLFLSAGAIINITGTNNIWKMNSNLLRSNKLLLAIFLVATCSISGVPPLAGFHSKDYIFLVVKHSQQSTVLILSILTAFLTSFYMFRLFFIIYFSTSTKDESVKSKKVGKSMYFPMIFLSLLSVFAGFINVEECLFYNFPHTHISHDFSLVATSIFVSISGLVTAYLVCFKFIRLEKYNILNIYYLLENKLFIDQAYLFIVHKIIFGIIAKFVAFFDKQVVDKTINMVGNTTINASKFLIFIHVNQLQTYAFFFIVGFLSFFIVLV